MPSLKNPRGWSLTEDGIKLAIERREKLEQSSFDIVFHSPLQAAQETALLVAGFDLKKTSRELREIDCKTVPSLYLNEDKEHPYTKAISKAFEVYRHGTLTEYFRVEGVREALLGLAGEAKAEITASFENAKARTGLVVGHSMLLQALCSKFCSDGMHFNDQVVGECEGFKLWFYENELRVNRWQKIP